MRNIAPNTSTFIAFVMGLLLLISTRPLDALSVEQLPNPRVQNEWVMDTAALLSPEQTRLINHKLSSLERDTGAEVALVIVGTVDTPTPKDFATDLFSHWKIGKDGRDNGLLILLVMSERRLEMETGYGLERSLSDGWLKRMQMSKMVPAFKAGDYATGLEAGIDAVVEKLGGNITAALPLSASNNPADSPRHAPYHSHPAKSSNYNEPEVPFWRAPWWLWLGGFGGIFLGIGAWFKRRKYKQDRTCPTCQEPMEMAPESYDDVYYDEGQIAEERLGSVDYQYYLCRACDFHRILRVDNWLSPYSKCSRCKRKTLSTSTKTIRYATQTSTGLQEITLECAHCKFHHTRQKTLPVVVPRNTSSSSHSSGYSGGGSSGGSSGGGGSFGGGSSGGGGAGSSW